MKILIITRLHELRHIREVVNRLEKEHDVVIFTAPFIYLPWWYKIIWQIEDYDFYYHKMAEQIDYYKERIFTDCPKWLKVIISLLPNLGFLKRFYKPPKQVYDKLKELNPDIVLATSLMFMPVYQDHQFALAAKNLGIPLIGFAPTWDCLTNKTFTYPKPDLMFCWNEPHKEQLIKYHGIKEDRIKIVGAYTLEKWLLPVVPMRRDKFCKKYDFDSKKPILLYLCSSPTIYGDETILIQNLAVQWHHCQILVQLHPDKPKEIKLKETKQIKFSVTDSCDNYFHCESVFGINTSAFLEANLLGKHINIIRVNDSVIHNSIHFKSLNPLWEGKQTIKQWLGIGEKLPSELVLEEIAKIGKVC